MLNIVLLGVGHTHLHILSCWERNPIPGVRLVCVSNQVDAAYSGMLPGVLAGNYNADEMKIDLLQRCEQVGAELILAETSQVDLKNRQLHFADGASQSFDLLSVGIGSRPAHIVGDDLACSIKPMQTFLQRLSQRIDQACSKRMITKNNPLKVVVVGGGAGGVEVSLCLPQFLTRKFGTDHFCITILHRGSQLLPGATERTVRVATKILRRRGVTLCLECEAVSICESGVYVRDSHALDRDQQQDLIDADVVISAVGAVAPTLLEKFDVAKDDRGFVITNAHLQAVDCNHLFVVGDSGSLENTKVPKAGVYAVRQGPVLWNNLKRAIDSQPLEQFQPQSQFLWLLNTGDHRAILQYHGIAIHAKWCWWLKNWIDKQFIGKHQR